MGIDDIKKALIELEYEEKINLENMLNGRENERIDLNWHGGKLNGIRCCLDLLNEHIERKGK